MDEDYEALAYHEAGHAYVAILLGGRVERVTLEPDYDDGPRREGDVQVAWHDAMSERELARRDILVSLAGPICESILRGEDSPEEPTPIESVPEWRADLMAAAQAASLWETHPVRHRAAIRAAETELRTLLSQDGHWAVVAAIADELTAHETLEWEQLTEIYRVWRVR